MNYESINEAFHRAVTARAGFERDIPVIRTLMNRPPEGTSPISLPIGELEKILVAVKTSGQPQELFVDGKRYLVSRDGGVTEAPLPTPTSDQPGPNGENPEDVGAPEGERSSFFGTFVPDVDTMLTSLVFPPDDFDTALELARDRGPIVMQRAGVELVIGKDGIPTVSILPESSNPSPSAGE